jgi:hypothetical protein
MMMNSTEKSALTTSFSLIIQTILSNDDHTYAIVKNNPVINYHYLIIHTFSGATAHSSCVARRVASLLLHNSVLICMQWSRSHGDLMVISSLQSLLD